MDTMIRLAETTDAEGIAEVYRPYVETTAISFEEEAPSPEMLDARRLAHAETHPWLVGCQEGAVVAYAVSSPHRTRAAYRWSVEVGLYVRATHHRGGLGRALYVALLSQLTEMGYQNAYAGVTQPNPTSVAFHQALGFSPIGTFPKVGYKMGAWRDVSWFHAPLGRTSTDLSEAPSAVRPVADVPFDCTTAPR